MSSVLFRGISGSAWIADFDLVSTLDSSAVLLCFFLVALCWISSELPDPQRLGSNDRPTCESGWPWAVSPCVWLHTRAHILRGERPERPSDVQPLGFPGSFWGSTSSCWSESRSNRQTARRLLGCLSTTWNVNMDMARSTNLVHKTKAKTEGKGVAKRILPMNLLRVKTNF